MTLNQFLYWLMYETEKDKLLLKSLAKEFHIESLEFKRKFNDLCWIYNTLNSKNYCPEILSSETTAEVPDWIFGDPYLSNIVRTEEQPPRWL